MNIIFISLISTILFGFIDASFFFLASDTVQKQIIKIPFFNRDMSEVLTGAVSASIAIFLANYIGLYIKKYYKIYENPFIDAAGILIGTIILLAIYLLFNYKNIKLDKTNKCPDRYRCRCNWN